jgi:hypothetical protein
MKSKRPQIIREATIKQSRRLFQKLIDRAVTIDLLYTEAECLSRRQGAGEDSPVTYPIKTVSERLEIRPAAVRQAYAHLEALGDVHILARQFPGGRRQQRQLPLDATGAGES